MKRQWISIAAVFILCLSAFPARVMAEEDVGAPPEISAPSVFLAEEKSLQPLYEYNADEKRAPASITKVMTMLLVMEAIDEGRITLEDKVSATPYASSMGGSQIWLEPGESMSVHELLKATAVASANDAAVALAEWVSGSEEEFVKQMNEKAEELGCENTHFVNCTGLDEEGHYTSARDIATMAGALLQHKKILEYTGIWMDELRGGETQLVNTNRLIYSYEGATGLKTGSTDLARRCLCATARRGDMGLISVVLGADNSTIQFGDSVALLDWGFENYTCVPVKSPDEELPLLPVVHGVKREVALFSQPPETVLIPRREKDKISYEITLSQEVTAPVEAEQIVGRVLVHVDSREICTFPIKAAEAVEEMTYPRALVRLWRSLVSMGNAEKWE